jgi:transposase InsO family protein
VVNITQEATVKFLKSTIYRFGVLKRVLSDNEIQFKGIKFLRCCADFEIHHQPSSAAHPQTNGQVECTNGLFLQGMKMRMLQDLEVKDKNWHKKLPSVHGPSGQTTTGPPEIRPLVWSMEQKQYCHPKSILNRLGCRILI